VVAPSRALPGVIHFDVARDVTDPDALIATPPEWTVYEVASAESPAM
jgi:quinol monooxygenase YgiN